MPTHRVFGMRGVRLSSRCQWSASRDEAERALPREAGLLQYLYRSVHRQDTAGEIAETHEHRLGVAGMAEQDEACRDHRVAHALGSERRGLAGHELRLRRARRPVIADFRSACLASREGVASQMSAWEKLGRARSCS